MITHFADQLYLDTKQAMRSNKNLQHMVVLLSGH